MKLKQLVDELSLRTCCVDENHLNADVLTAYCGDLLSDVMAHVPQGAVWFTVLGHLNIVAVAQLRDVAAIVIVNGTEPDKQTIEKAVQQGIAVFSSKDNSAQLCMKIAGKL